MVELNFITFAILMLFASLGLAGIIGVMVKVIVEEKRTRKVKVVKMQKYQAFGVAVSTLDLFTYEDICKNRTTETCKKVDNFAKTFGCTGVLSKGNDAIYLFCVESLQKQFYNSVKQLAKSKLIAEPIKAERVVQ